MSTFEEIPLIKAKENENLKELRRLGCRVQFKLIKGKKTSNMIRKENACCKCGLEFERLFHLKDVHGIHGDYCNVCFNNENETLVKHKHRYPLRFKEHDHKELNPKYYVVYELVN